MLGYSREELLSVPVSAVHPEEMAILQAFTQDVFEHGRGWTNELSCLTKSGQQLPAEISASTIEVGGTKQIIAMVRDITERRQAEAAERGPGFGRGAKPAGPGDSRLLGPRADGHHLATQCLGKNRRGWRRPQQWKDWTRSAG